MNRAKKLVIGMDVDGFIAHYDGWKGHYTIGPPMTGAKEEISHLMMCDHVICLCSCTPTHIVQEWAHKYSIPYHYINDSPYPRDGLKLAFDVYIGDETMTFDGKWKGLAQKIMSFRRHWHKEDQHEDWTPAVAGWSSHSPELYWKGVGRLQIDVFEEYHQQILNHADERPVMPVFMTVCSWGKPYGHDYLHYTLRRNLAMTKLLDELDYWHISSAGIIPHERMTQYPYYAYDWNNEWGDETTNEILEKAITRRLDEWFEAYVAREGYKRPVIVYAREGGHTIYAVRQSRLGSIATIIGADPSDRAVQSVRFGLLPSAVDVNDYLITPRNLAIMLDTVGRVLRAHK
jgi:hypothetical protein